MKLHFVWSCVLNRFRNCGVFALALEIVSTLVFVPVCKTMRTNKLQYFCCCVLTALGFWLPFHVVFTVFFQSAFCLSPEIEKVLFLNSGRHILDALRGNTYCGNSMFVSNGCIMRIILRYVHLVCQWWCSASELLNWQMYVHFWALSIAKGCMCISSFAFF